MTRDRIIGEDTPFGAWMRRNEKLSSTEFVTCDIDHCIHRYKTTVDGYNTRKIQNLMFLEVKQFGAGLRDSQRDTLYKLHKTMSTNGVVRIDGSFVRNWGVSVLALQKTDPEDSDWMTWGRFDGSGKIDWGDTRRPGHNRFIDIATLEKLKMFDIHPDNFSANPNRRHHATRMFEALVQQPLGFPVWETVIQRS
jgi:hypothetical protein